MTALNPYTGLTIPRSGKYSTWIYSPIGGGTGGGSGYSSPFWEGNATAWDAKIMSEIAQGADSRSGGHMLRDPGILDCRVTLGGDYDFAPGNAIFGSGLAGPTTGLGAGGGLTVGMFIYNLCLYLYQTNGASSYMGPYWQFNSMVVSEIGNTARVVGGSFVQYSVTCLGSGTWIAPGAAVTT